MAWFLIIVGVLLVGFVVYAVMFTYPRGSGDAQDRAKALNEKYSTDMNRFAAMKETKASSARRDLIGTLGEEMSAAIGASEVQRRAETSAFDDAHNLERLNWNLEIERGSYQTLLDQNALTRQLIGKAASKDMDVATYLELEKKVQFDRLELDKQWQEAEQQLKAGFIFQLQAYQHLALMTEYIGKLYDRAKQLQAEGKDREYKLIEEHIEFMEGDFRGRQKRLVQTLEQENVQRGDENTDAGGDGTETIQAAQE